MRAWIAVCLVASLGPILDPTTEENRKPYPAARRTDQVDVLHGVRVADPYRWMEDMKSSETLAWVRAQDELLKDYLRPLRTRDAIYRRMLELIGGIRYLAPVKANGRYFSMGVDSAGTGSILEVRTGLQGSGRVLVDLRSRYPGRNVRLRGFSPSDDARFVAYTLSERQSSWLEVRLLDTITLEDRPIAGKGVHTISSRLTWPRENTGFFAVHYEAAAGVPEDKAPPVRPKLLFHPIDGASERVVYTPPDRPNIIVTPTRTPDGRYLVLAVSEGSSSKNTIAYQDLKGPGNTVTLIADADASYTFLGSRGPLFWFYTDLRAPRGRVVEVDTSHPARSEWREVVQEGAAPVAANSAVGGNALGLFGDRFVLMYLKDGLPLLSVFDLRGRLVHTIDLPQGGSIWGGLSGTQDDPEVFFQFLGLTDLATVYRLDVRTGRTSVVRHATVSFDRSIVVRRIFYRSKDGTRVPMYIAHRRDLRLDGTNPTYLYGYGAFGWVSFPWYQPFVINWLEKGGVYAQPGIRGGGEYGEIWHQAGMGRLEQNSIDDYFAAAQWLIDNGYTTSRRLVANGGSASGGLAAAAVLQRPELFGAAVIDRPVLDMMRFDQFTQASYWLPEFGSPRDPDDFRALFAWSPYHNVKRGICYPPLLVMSGTEDHVAVPLHAFKFTAAMQDAQGCANPVMLKVMWGAGHNFGSTPEQNSDSWTDETAFLLRAMKANDSIQDHRSGNLR